MAFWAWKSIWLGTRLFMLLDTDDAYRRRRPTRRRQHRHATHSGMGGVDVAIQAPTPWTPEGQKWTAMTRLFDLRDYP